MELTDAMMSVILCDWYIIPLLISFCHFIHSGGSTYPFLLPFDGGGGNSVIWGTCWYLFWFLLNSPDDGTRYHSLCALPFHYWWAPPSLTTGLSFIQCLILTHHFDDLWKPHYIGVPNLTEAHLMTSWKFLRPLQWLILNGEIHSEATSISVPRCHSQIHLHFIQIQLPFCGAFTGGWDLSAFLHLLESVTIGGGVILLPFWCHSLCCYHSLKPVERYQSRSLPSHFCSWNSHTLTFRRPWVPMWWREVWGATVGDGAISDHSLLSWSLGDTWSLSSLGLQFPFSCCLQSCWACWWYLMGGGWSIKESQLLILSMKWRRKAKWRISKYSAIFW